MNKTFDVVIAGASTTVGETLVEILYERKFPLGKLYLVDAEGAAGGRLDCNGKTLKIESINSFDFTKAQLAFFTSTEVLSKEFAAKATEQGCIVIDRTPAFRKDKDVPLIIPEVNADDIGGYTKRKIISSPSCATIQMLVALKPIHDAVGVKRINVSTYQSVSGSGKNAAEELASQTAALLNFRDVKCKTYPKQIAFNVLPQIGEFQDNGYTDEEMKIVWETQRIFNDDSIGVNPTTVRVPVFIGHSASVHIETRDKISATKATELLKQAKGVELLDTRLAGGWPTPVTEAAGSDQVFVGRLREDISSDSGLNMWVVSDNIRKGGALNCVQIAEILVKLYL
jgi:aspartate-semialdehyde dehydrogenase